MVAVGPVILKAAAQLTSMTSMASMASMMCVPVCFSLPLPLPISFVSASNPSYKILVLPCVSVCQAVCCSVSGGSCVSGFHCCFHHSTRPVLPGCSMRSGILRCPHTLVDILLEYNMHCPCLRPILFSLFFHVCLRYAPCFFFFRCSLFCSNSSLPFVLLEKQKDQTTDHH